jgi:hypothetical protein
MAKQLIDNNLYNQDSERCDHFYETGKSYNYNDCCIKFFIERAIKKNSNICENRPFIGLSTGCMLCPECSDIDEEMIKVLCLLTRSKDCVIDPCYTKHPEGVIVRLT